MVELHYIFVIIYITEDLHLLRKILIQSLVFDCIGVLLILRL